MKSLYFFIALMVLNISLAQDRDIVGETNKEDIRSTSHRNWFEANYQNYKPQPQSIKQLNELFNENDFSIQVYFGTWCSDSQREVPRLIKLLEESNFNFNHLELIGVGRDKKVPNVSKAQQRKLNITNVPTIIVYQDGEELNRFVEYAQESLEKDLIKIFSKQPYKHSYQD
ncbi:MAG: glycerophosphodiester phosphodiesterase [Bacteroidetes bacterium]|jgi:thiol-disulfide isomerase/thioredoxin|nr:glycerophosphodiester phosphodiesterase [Bacteroidota bacterium]